MLAFFEFVIHYYSEHFPPKNATPSFNSEQAASACSLVSSLKSSEVSCPRTSQVQVDDLLHDVNVTAPKTTANNNTFFILICCLLVNNVANLLKYMESPKDLDERTDVTASKEGFFYMASRDSFFELLGTIPQLLS